MLMIEAYVRKKKHIFYAVLRTKGLNCSPSAAPSAVDGITLPPSGGFEKRTSEQRRLLQSMYAWQRLMINVC